MMLAIGDRCYIAQRPHLDFAKQPVGMGDLISALFTGGLLQGKTAVEAFQHCNNASYGILKETLARHEWELHTIAAQESLEPLDTFNVTELIRQCVSFYTLSMNRSQGADKFSPSY